MNPDQYIERVGRGRVPHVPDVPRARSRRAATSATRASRGVRRFLDRLWASVHDARRDGAPDADGACASCTRRSRRSATTSRGSSYNTAIAAMMEYMNALRAGERTPHVDEVRAARAARRARSRRTSPRSCGSVLGAHGERVRRGLAGVRRGARRGGHVDDGRAGERQDARHDHACRSGVTQDEAVAAAMAEPNVAKFVTGRGRRG